MLRTGDFGRISVRHNSETGYAKHIRLDNADSRLTAMRSVVKRE